MMKLTLDERRRTIGRSVLNLTNKSGPLSPIERSSLRRLMSEADDLEDDIVMSARRKYAAAYRSWLRFGSELTQESPGITIEERRILEQRDMGTGGQAAYPSATTGFFVPVEFNAQVDSALAAYGPMLDPNIVTIQNTVSGAPRGFPEDNDTQVAGEQVDEHSQVSDTDIAGLSQVILKAYKFSSKMCKIDSGLVQDVGFDLDAYLSDRFGIRIARALNPKLTNGSGTGEPLGVATQAAQGAIAVGSATNTGANDGANTIGSGDLARLEASVDFAYRPNARFMFHPNTLSALRQVLDKTGRPLFPGLHNAGEDSIFGYPCSINPALDQLPAMPSSPPVTKKTVLFGDFSKYVVRKAPPILLRLPLRFVDYGQIAFILFIRADGALIDGGGGAVKYLANTL